MTYTCTATSQGGTNERSVTVKRDATDPTFAPSVSPNPVLLNGSANATSGAADTLSGIATQSCDAVDTSTVGPQTVSCTATDLAGNTATANADYSVIYNFAGFFQPVENMPIVNIAVAGSAIPVKFSLAGYQGMTILAAGYPMSSEVMCDANEPGSSIDETVNPGGSSLTYDPISGRYSYTWKTQKVWRGTCRILIVRLADGTNHYAKFRFK
jgi:hypothetical protein